MGRSLTPAAGRAAAWDQPPPAGPGSPGPLRVTVLVDEHDRRDLVVPAGLLVGELVPELAAWHGGVAPTRPATGSMTLVRADGSPLHPGLGLSEQQVADGDVLCLLTAEQAAPRDAVDDPVHAVRAVARPAPSPAGRRDRWRGSVLLAVPLVVSAAAVARDRSPGLLVAGAVLVLSLAVVGVVTARTGRDVPTGVVAVTGSVLLSAALLLPGSRGVADGALRLGGVLLAAGLALACTGRACAGASLPLCVPAVALLVAGGTAPLTPEGLPRVAAVLGVAVVLVARAAPWVALSTDRLERATQVAPAGERGPCSVGGIDLEIVAAEVDRAGRLTGAMVLGSGLALAVVAPPVVSSGPAGAVLLTVLATQLALLGRPSTQALLRTTAHVGAAVVLLVVALTALVAVPSLGPVVAGTGIVLAVAAVARAALGTAGTGWDRARGALERCRGPVDTLLVLATLPVLAVVLGLLPGLPGLSGLSGAVP